MGNTQNASIGPPRHSDTARRYHPLAPSPIRRFASSPPRPPSRRFQRGLTLIECMVLLVTISIVAVAAGVGLQSVAKVPGQADAVLAINSAAVDRMEQMRAEPWATMATKATALTNTSPGISIDGKYYPCTVTVVQADANGDGIADADFRQVTVQVASRSLVTYVVQP